MNLGIVLSKQASAIINQKSRNFWSVVQLEFIFFENLYLEPNGWPQVPKSVLRLEKNLEMCWDTLTTKSY